MKKLRILLTNMHRGGWGGQPNLILTTAYKLTERGHFIMIAAPQNSTLVNRAKARNIPTFDSLQFPRGIHLSILGEIRKIKNVLGKNEIDIIHTNGSQDTWTGAIAAKTLIKSVIVVRTRHNTFPIKDHFLNRYLYKSLIDKVTVLSAGTIDRFRDFTGSGILKKEDISVIHACVDIEKFNLSISGEKIRKELNLSEKQPLVGIVGRLAQEKGHKFLFEAANEIIKEFPDCRFLVVGTGPLRKELEQMCVNLGIKDKVLFLGLRTDIPEITAAFKVAVVAAVDCESSSITMKEAMALQKPVVSTSFPGAYEIVEDGRNGIVVPIGDSKKMSEAIISILKDPDKAHRMGLRGREIVEEKFTEKIWADKMEEVYYEVMERAGRLK